MGIQYTQYRDFGAKHKINIGNIAKFKRSRLLFTFFILDFRFHILDSIRGFDLRTHKNAVRQHKRESSERTSRVIVFPVKVFTKICISVSLKETHFRMITYYPDSDSTYGSAAM